MVRAAKACGAKRMMCIYDRLALTLRQGRLCLHVCAERSILNVAERNEHEGKTDRRATDKV